MAPLNAPTDVVACLQCDLLHRKIGLPKRAVARCRRCNAVLYQKHGATLERMLAVTLTAVIVFLIANSFPIVELQAQGITTRTTLFGAIIRLWQEQKEEIAALVLLSTIIFPLSEMLALIYLILPLWLRRRPPAFDEMLRIVIAVRPWGMIEVFMLGTLVTLVKLSSVARLITEPALYAFGTLTLLSALIYTFDPRSLWDIAEHRCGRRLHQRAQRRANARRAATDAAARQTLPPLS